MRRTLAVCMILAPHLATYTYACPSLIAPLAVAGVGQRIKPVRHALYPMPQIAKEATRLKTATRPRQIRIDPKVAKDPSLLVRMQDAWRSVGSLPREQEVSDVSDASLKQHTTTHGGIEWHVEAPITFGYRVREEPDVLDPASDALLFGHISDKDTLAFAKSRPLKRVVVVDEAVHAHYGERIEAYFEHHGVETRLLVLPTTEENKNMDLVLKIAETIHDLGIDRRLDPVIAIGGGVAMDIVGFAASIYRRRTPYIRVPTTLMGYVDASVGAKSGVNFYTPTDGWRKNKLGAYQPPVLTLLDRSFLATLDERQLANGAAEIAKMALVKDPELFHLLRDHGPQLIQDKFQDAPDADAPNAPSRVLYLAIQTMLEELAPNLWEDSLERLVDFGHVFSMELEMKALYEDKLFHGEAVAIDMAFSSVLSYVRGHLDARSLDEVLQMMRGLGLPVYHEDFDVEMVAQAMYERVKFSQGQKIPLPTGKGVAHLFNDITEDQLKEALAEWAARCAPQ
jgi:3-dehydroquinate synthetase